MYILDAAEDRVYTLRKGMKMASRYETPKLTSYGDVTQITGVFGASGANDVFIDRTGNDISNQHDPGPPGGSIDACATPDQQVCLP